MGQTPPTKQQEENRLRGLSARIMHFSPSWFSVTMGTGISATLIQNSPYPQVVERLKPVCAAITILNVFLFCAFTAVFVIRYVRWPYIANLTLSHPLHSLFLGTWPMSSLTCISGIISMTHAYSLGNSWLWVMSYCWWITVAISSLLAFTVPFLSYTTHRNVPEGITASLILPVVPLITCAAIGATLAEYFTFIDAPYAMHIWLCSYSVLGIGILLALMILTLYLQRLIFHHIPPNETIISSFLPLGPCGLAGFSILKLGAVAIHLFPFFADHGDDEGIRAGMAMAGWALWGVGVGSAILLWALGIWFACVACGSLFVRWREGVLQFNMGWWALVFPLASMDLSTLLIGKELNSAGFNVIGTVFTLLVVILWLSVSVPTIRGALSGNKRVFAAPCLARFREDKTPRAPLSSPADLHAERGTAGGGGGEMQPGGEMTESEVTQREERASTVAASLADSGKSQRPIAEKDLGEALDAEAARH